MPRPQGSLKLIGGIFAAFGLVFGSVGALVWKFDRDFEQDAVRAPGEVVRLQGGGKGSKPVVRFIAEAEDREVEITGRVSSSPTAYSVGERVTVMYPPGHPEDGRLVGFLEQYFLSTVFCGLGGVFTLIGAGLLIADFRNRMRPGS
ncbi:MAG: DUF3592 domain-containing protein [Planctomycetes bacterium]|nr:DUF3592 domain-containing protein [Planctomycetota bacterium]MBI3829449.1 DUF3592 domain-containing protein [Planctomycetota bacterium]